MDKLDKLNRLYDKHKDSFVPGICGYHNLLWQVMINGSLKGRDCCLGTGNTKPEGMEIVICDRDVKGYTPTGAILKESNFDKAWNIVDDINTTIFGIDKDRQMELVLSTMGKRKKARGRNIHERCSRR